METNQEKKLELFETMVSENYRIWLAYAICIARDRSKAEDTLQDALLRAYMKLDSFDASKDLSSWVYGFIRNTHYELVRLDYKQYLLLEEFGDLYSQMDSPTAAMFDALEACLERLPEELQSPIRLFYYEHFPSQAVADQLAINDATVRKRLERARKSLGICIWETVSKAE